MRRKPIRSGVDLIVREREKQLEKWSPDHDDEHKRDELIYEAQCLIGRALGLVPPSQWYDPTDDPWGLVEKHGHDKVRCLSIAGALIAAEIDRLQRQREQAELSSSCMPEGEAAP